MVVRTCAVFADPPGIDRRAELLVRAGPPMLPLEAEPVGEDDYPPGSTSTSSSPASSATR